MNSRLFWFLLNLFCGQHKYSGYVNVCPVPDHDPQVSVRIEQETQEACSLIRHTFMSDETTREFVAPLLPQRTESLSEASKNLYGSRRAAAEDLRQRDRYINEAVEQWYGVRSEHLGPVIAFAHGAPVVGDEVCPWPNEDPFKNYLAANLVSYCFGCALGRWDIRIATGTRRSPDLPDSFELLPSCPPGMLETDCEGPNDYPIEISVNGILVNDPDHTDDTVRRVIRALEIMFSDARAIEREVCDIFGVRTLADYFRNPKYFFGSHIKRYSKSRRKAPIYWLLQSPNRSYSLWLYYHRLDRDTLSKALVLYVEPKIRLEEGRLEELRTQRSTSDPSSTEARTADKALERQESVLSDLYDFRDRLKRAADLNLVPDLDDGVVLTMAPLWELVPWKEPKLYWDELMAGKHAWSSIGRQLRAKGLVAE